MWGTSAFEDFEVEMGEDRADEEGLGGWDGGVERGDAG